MLYNILLIDVNFSDEIETLKYTNKQIVEYIYLNLDNSTWNYVISKITFVNAIDGTYGHNLKYPTREVYFYIL